MSSPIKSIVFRTHITELRPRGQDLGIYAQHADGSESPIHNAISMRVFCNGRSQKVIAVLVLGHVTLDGVHADVADAETQKHEEIDFWKSEAERFYASCPEEQPGFLGESKAAQSPSTGKPPGG